MLTLSRSAAFLIGLVSFGASAMAQQVGDPAIIPQPRPDLPLVPDLVPPRPATRLLRVPRPPMGIRPEVGVDLPLFLFPPEVTVQYQLGDPGLGGMGGEVVQTDLFEQYAAEVRDWVGDPAVKGGLVLSASQFRSTARLAITWSDGAASAERACSGVLVSSAQVLTAAHCVCGTMTAFGTPGPGYAADAAACDAQLSRLSIDVILPTAGIFRVVGIDVHDGYHSPEEPPVDPPLPLADLALLQLDEPVPLAPVSHIGLGDAERHVLAGFGTLAFAAVPEGSIFVAGRPYQVGAQQISVQQVALDAAECGADAAIDVICSTYNEAPFLAGRFMDAGVCEGDSGSPLYAIDTSGAVRVAGIASYYVSQGSTACRGEAGSSRVNFFVDLAQHGAWLTERIAVSDLAEDSMECGDYVFLGPDTYSLSALAGLVSITAFQPLPAEAIADPGVAGSQTTCEAAQRSLVCRFDGAEMPRISLPEALAQVVLCLPEEEP